ncbi:hypothetical protein HK098_005648 [Nowakowskiella sp. JEL0407]|nr:hypothetical protein HK098_005648 [Nowakowskiella sp. JEL0407]
MEENNEDNTASNDALNVENSDEDETKIESVSRDAINIDQQESTEIENESKVEKNMVEIDDEVATPQSEKRNEVVEEHMDDKISSEEHFKNPDTEVQERDDRVVVENSVDHPEHNEEAGYVELDIKTLETASLHEQQQPSAVEEIHTNSATSFSKQVSESKTELPDDVKELRADGNKDKMVNEVKNSASTTPDLQVGHETTTPKSKSPDVSVKCETSPVISNGGVVNHDVLVNESTKYEYLPVVFSNESKKNETITNSDSEMRTAQLEKAENEINEENKLILQRIETANSEKQKLSQLLSSLEKEIEILKAQSGILTIRRDTISDMMKRTAAPWREKLELAEDKIARLESEIQALKASQIQIISKALDLKFKLKQQTTEIANQTIPFPRKEKHQAVPTNGTYKTVEDKNTIKSRNGYTPEDEKGEFSKYDPLPPISAYKA